MPLPLGFSSIAYRAHYDTVLQYYWDVLTSRIVAAEVHAYTFMLLLTYGLQDLWGSSARVPYLSCVLHHSKAQTVVKQKQPA